ncbi:hypothetical protein [Streptomyces sp. SID3915]|uniref:hypothetical protein n=1 Tax=Streptomyces sp. SID3915 TaxID=2690263 RepID=UPI00136ED089|nr:hypothetical protein [Streptomyces sp. SID3915]MYX71522.1 hypothetical protein [Streptomyces sp. SID3915]
MAPFVFILDDQKGSLRHTSEVLFHAAASAAERSENSGALITHLLRIVVVFVLLVTYYALTAFGPTIVAFRVALGYPGIKLPGREAVMLYRNTSVVRACSLAIIAISAPIGKTGERRVTKLHDAVEAIDAFRRSLRSLVRLEAGPRGGRRGRKRVVRRHVKRISTFLKEFEGQLGNASDQEIRDFGLTLVEMSTRLADRRYGALLDEELIQQINVPERETTRLALGAVLVLVLSGASMFFLSLLGLADSLQPVAIGVSIVVSAVIVFRGKAMEKLETLGMFGSNSGPPPQQ